MFKIGVLVSGSGTNMTKLLENDIKIDVVIADRECYALEVAKNYGIKTFNVGRSNTNENILEILKSMDIDLLVLAGFLSILNKDIIKKYKIINIHPSLLPKYGGRGMYGMNVHREVFKNKEKFSGCTVHYVNEGVDTGEIIDRTVVNIEDCFTPEEIAKKVLLEEWKLLPKVVKKIIEDNKKENNE